MVSRWYLATMHYFVVFLDLKPKIKGDETTYNTIFIGKTLFIFCAFDACNLPATVTWFKVCIKTNFIIFGLKKILKYPKTKITYTAVYLNYDFRIQQG